MLQRLARAFVVGTVLVLAIDALLHLALGAIRDDAMAAPWWVNARIVERSVWVIAAMLLWWTAPWVAASMPRALEPSGDVPRLLSRQAAHRIVGMAMIGVPLLWFLATVIAFAVDVTVRREWPDEGGRLLSPYVYSEALLANAPWLLAGAALIMIARHVPTE